MDTTADDLDEAGLPSRPPTALGLPGSRAVVVGTGTHVAGSALPGLPAVAATVTAVRDALTTQCRMDDPHVIPVTDPEGLPQFLDAVNQAAAQADDILLLYYVGHGLVNLAGEFFLATSATTDRDVMLPAEALPFAAIRGALSVSRARHVVVVPDCCFSGRAPGEFATAVADAFELTNLQGSYLLTATSATEQACFGPLASRRRERYPECMHALTAVATAVGPSGSESAPEERLRAALEAAGVRQLRRRAGRRPRVAPN